MFLSSLVYVLILKLFMDSCMDLFCKDLENFFLCSFIFFEIKGIVYEKYLG